MGSGLAGPLLFWLDEGMSEVRKFEMQCVGFADAFKHRRFWFLRLFSWLMLISLVIFGKKLTVDPLNLEVWMNFLFAGVIVICRWFPGWIPQPKSRTLLLSEATLQFPVKVFGTKEIPWDRVEEVVPTTEGLIIAWKKDGVPWYTEVMERWFSAEEWAKVRAALLEWGNRRGGF
jgi:hypothetical protein